MADEESNQTPAEEEPMYTTHTSSAGIPNQILYPVSEVDAKRAGAYAAGQVPTLEIGEDEVWPPEEDE